MIEHAGGHSTKLDLVNAAQFPYRKPVHHHEIEEQFLPSVGTYRRFGFEHLKKSWIVQGELDKVTMVFAIHFGQLLSNLLTLGEQGRHDAAESNRRQDCRCASVCLADVGKLPPGQIVG